MSSLFRLALRLSNATHAYSGGLLSGKRAAFVALSPIMYNNSSYGGEGAGCYSKTIMDNSSIIKRHLSGFTGGINGGRAMTVSAGHGSINITTMANLTAASIDVASRRTLTSQPITKNMQLYSATARNVDKDPKTFKLKKPLDRPLVVMFSWLQAKQKHLQKFAKIYTDRGFEVLIVAITPWQLLWPTKGSQLVADDVVRFLENNITKHPLVLHGFSVGAYMWGECLVKICRDIDRYGPAILDRIVAQVWDSAADITEIPEGVPRALFPRNKTMQATLKKYMLYHLKTFHEPATSHYIRSSQMFHGNLALAPALFLISKTDPVGAEASNRRVVDNWTSRDIHVTWQCWERSPHVAHFQKHKEEYMQYWMKHLADNGLIKPEQMQNQIRAKL